MGREGMLFVGIEEKGAAHFALRTAPTGDAALPAGDRRAIHPTGARHRGRRRGAAAPPKT